MLETVSILSLLGASVGSFLNVCAFRIPRRISVTTLRSFCPNCHLQLRWFELLPLVSFVIQRGRCHSCSSSIPLQYPLVEMLAAGLAILLFILYGLSPALLISFSFASLMLLIAVIDWKYFLIPNSVVATGAAVGVVLLSLFSPESVPSRSFEMISVPVLLLVIRAAGSALFKKNVMGMGDVKLGGVIAVYVGFQGFLVALWSAAVIGSIFGILRSLMRRGDDSDIDARIAFGSFLAATSFVVLLLKDHIEYLIESWLTLIP